MIISIGRETRPANQPASQPAPASCPLTRDGWLPFCFAPTGNARRCFPSFLLFVSRDAVAFGRYLDDWKLRNFSLVIFFFRVERRDFGRYLNDWKLGNFSLVIFFFFGGGRFLGWFLGDQEGKFELFEIGRELNLEIFLNRS